MKFALTVAGHTRRWLRSFCVRDMSNATTKSPGTRSSGAAAKPVQTFSYQKPEKEQQGHKEIVLLCKGKRMRGAVHIVRKGGEEHLHSHKTVDGFWMVLSGRVRFHGEGDTVIGEFGPMEGLLVPRNTRYWFETVGEDELELLQVLGFDAGKGFQRDDHARPNFDPKSIKWFDGRKGTVEAPPVYVSGGGTVRRALRRIKRTALDFLGDNR